VAGARDERLAGPAEGTVKSVTSPPRSGGNMFLNHVPVLVNDTSEASAVAPAAESLRKASGDDDEHDWVVDTAPWFGAVPNLSRRA